MGYMKPFEQRHVETLYGHGAHYRCNYCRLPIWDGQLYVQDPKGGFWKKPPGLPDFAPRQPKVTYHQSCDDEVMGRKPREHSLETKPKSVDEVSAWVLDVIGKRKDGQWRVRKLIKIYPGKVSKDDMRAAVRQLKKEKKLARVAGYLTLAVPKKKKENRHE